MVEDNIDNTAFRTPDGFFERFVMPFVLINAPACFIDLMSRVFREFLNKFAVVFMDDILIFSKSEQEHALHLREVMDTLRAHQLKAKFSKCHFWREEVRFLRHVLSKEGPRKSSGGARLKDSKECNRSMKFSRTSGLLQKVH